jgi:PEP-CTERM motif-containing protein
MLRRVLLLSVGLAVSWAASSQALTLANILDLTSAGSTATVNDALFSQIVSDPTGTGYYDPFLRLQNSPIEEAFNTDFRDNGQAPLDAKSDPHTHSVLMNTLKVVNQGGIDYYMFTLDIDEPNDGPKSLISLDELRLYVEDAPDLDQLSDLTHLAWDMDANMNSTVYLDGSNLSSGNGGDDMSLLVRKSYFDAIGATGDQYLYLYSKFGATSGLRADPNFDADASFEEWAAVLGQAPPPPPQVPEPGTMVLLGSGLVGVVVTGMRRRKR